MKHLRFSFVSVLAALFATVAPAAPLTQLVPEGAPFVLSVTDVQLLLNGWDQSPWARTWNDEQVKKFFAPLRSQMKMDEWDDLTKAETGHTVRELLALAQGEALLAVTDLNFVGEDAPQEFPFLLAIGIGANSAKVEELIAEADKKDEAPPAEIEDYAGVKLHVYTETKEEKERTFVWAIVDGVWMISGSRATISSAIDASKGGGLPNALAKSERFLRAQQSAGSAQALAYVDLQAIVPLAQRAIETSAAAGAAQGGAASMFEASAVIRALGLDVLNDFSLAFDLQEGASDFSGALTYSDRRGLINLLAYEEGPAAQPAFVPARWVSAASMKYSLKKAYAALETILDQMSPVLYGMVDGQIKGLNRQLGIDLKRDLIGSIGNDVITGYALRPGAAPGAPAADLDQFIGFSLENAEAFTNAVEALKRMGGPNLEQMLVKREYLGHSMFVFTPPGDNPASKGMSYAITPNFLFMGIGSPATVEAALQGLPGNQPSLWQRPEVKTALSHMPANASAIQFQDTKALLGYAFDSAANMLGQTETAPAAAAVDENGDPVEAEPAKPMVDASAKPDAATLAKYWSYSWGSGYMDSRGVYFRSTIDHPSR